MRTVCVWTVLLMVDGGLLWLLWHLGGWLVVSGLLAVLALPASIIASHAINQSAASGPTRPPRESDHA